MPRYADIDALLSDLPDDLPYKASVKRVLIQAPAADVVPREALDQLKTILEEVWLEKAGFEGAAKQIIEGLKAEVEKYRSVVERDIVIVGRRQGKEAESREIIRYRADLIREAAVEEVIGEIERALNDHYHKDVCMGDTVASYYDYDLGDDVAEIRKKHLPKECPSCKHFVGCEKANWVRGCEEYREKERRDV